MRAAFGPPVRGVVVAFDERKGYGTVRADTAPGAGGEGGDTGELFFHCTEIADGSRTIAVGTRVDYDVVPGRLGRWEAAHLRPVSD